MWTWFCNCNHIIPDLDHAKLRTRSDTYGLKKLHINNMCSTKAEAIEQGHDYYFTGRPCKHGHISPRNKRGECARCAVLLQKLFDERKKQNQD